MNTLTYRDVVQEYSFKLSLVFRANTPQELKESFDGLQEFSGFVTEAIAASKIDIHRKRMEIKLVQSKILESIEKNLQGTFKMYQDEIDFKQVLAKMHADLDTYNNILVEDKFEDIVSDMDEVEPIWIDGESYYSLGSSADKDLPTAVLQDDRTQIEELIKHIRGNDKKLTERMMKFVETYDLEELSTLAEQEWIRITEKRKNWSME